MAGKNKISPEEQAKMQQYVYVSKSRITKGNKVVNEDNLCLLDEVSLKKCIENKIIKKQKPQKNHGSKEQINIEGTSD